MLLVDTDGGCLLRPLLRVDWLRALPALLRDAPSHTQLVAALLAAGALEYVDKQEEEHCASRLSPRCASRPRAGARTRTARSTRR